MADPVLPRQPGDLRFDGDPVLGARIAAEQIPEKGQSFGDPLVAVDDTSPHPSIVRPCVPGTAVVARSPHESSRWRSSGPPRFTAGRVDGLKCLVRASRARSVEGGPTPDDEGN